ncbi:hypothetical protein E5Q_02330 [Mixia osmundae IAM 14324]|uniref:Uncharacterized protein n=1 Tax=Mixia osmundae (strain CBS 9802 / IAM 14324 / JCM 22182 / KY 12970) TaxID=764103 RepID=G7DYL3_MIXOS|nr:hypothetical protein E5Q_02330 [Mixia osmundae IAM 14324]
MPRRQSAVQRRLFRDFGVRWNAAARYFTAAVVIPATERRPKANQFVRGISLPAAISWLLIYADMLSSAAQSSDQCDLRLLLASLVSDDCLV